jgi:hypothetical protein
VKFQVAPELSVRTTGMIAIAGSATPGLSAAIIGSFHRVILSVKMAAIVAPDRRRPVSCWPLTVRLYANVTAPAVPGT